jgi:hypothetical protein
MKKNTPTRLLRYIFFMVAIIEFTPSHSQAQNQDKSGQWHSPRVLNHVTVYKEKGRFGGWPANHGIWSWGNEILVGFGRGWYKDLGDRHHIDRERSEEHWFARSLDGGRSWQTEDPSEDIVPSGEELFGHPLPHLVSRPITDCPGNIDFFHPGFAMAVRMFDGGPGSVFYTSFDRGKRWQGPYRLPLFGLEGVNARTDYLIDGKHECTLFLTDEQGRSFCARTTDGAKTWQFLAHITPPLKEFAIMPASVRLSPEKILVTVRRRQEEKRWIDAYLSEDNGLSWAFLNTPVKSTGEGNPPAMIRLSDGRICLTYGYRAEPFGIRAVLSNDKGRTWSEPVILRDDGASKDLGYTRTVQRPDGKLVTVYYYNDTQAPERYIAATIWHPGEKIP